MDNKTINKLSESLKPYINDLAVRIGQSTKKENSGLIQSLNNTVIRLDERMTENKKDHEEIKITLEKYSKRISYNSKRINWIYAWSAGVASVASFAFYFIKDKFFK